MRDLIKYSNDIMDDLFDAFSNNLLDPFGFSPSFDSVTSYLTTFPTVGKFASTFGVEYNLRKINDNEYEIEVPVAGYKEDELDVTLENGYLTIKGKKVQEEKSDYLHRGIRRNFVKMFTVDENVNVEEAYLNNGLLTIRLKKMTTNTKRIPIKKQENSIIDVKSNEPKENIEE